MAILGEVFSIIRNGASIKQIDGANGFPITRIETISNRVIDRNRLGYANVFDITEYESYVLQSGDILMSHINSEKHLGKTALYIKKGNEKIIHGMNLLMLRANSEVILPLYAKYFFDSNLFLKQIPNITKKSVNQASFTVTALKKLEIKIPQMVEQKRIIDIMSRLDNIIQYRKDQLEKLDLFVKSRFVELFGELKSNSKKWVIEPFDYFATIDGNMTTDFVKYANYPHIGIDSIEKNSGILKGYKTVKEDGVKSGKYIFNEEHIIYSKIRPNLNKVALPDFEGLCSADAYPILVKKDVCNRIYLVYVMRSSYFLDYILAFSSRTNMPKVNRAQVKGFSMPLPPVQLQNQFASFVMQVDKSKLAIQQSLDELETLKKSLMQQYFG